MKNSFEEFFGINKENINIQEILDNNFRSKLTRLRSMFLPENKFMQEKLKEANSEYKKILEEYMFPTDKVQEYNEQNPNEIKSNFIEPENPNVGWKFHLNVIPEHVKSVSEYLINNGYNHKYLSGGEIEDGKIFTIYIGSYEMAKKLSEDLSRDLVQYLCDPAENQEIEFARGIVGRFVVSKRYDFVPFSYHGFPIKKEDERALGGFKFLNKENKGTDFEDKKDKLLRDAEEKAFKELIAIYGNYFFESK